MTATLPASVGQRAEPRNHFVLHGVSWQLYEMLLKEVGDQLIYITYDSGSLELMSPSPTHERWKKVIGAMIEMIALEMARPCEMLGSTTFRRQDLEKGLEPDECYYFENAARVTGKSEIDLRRDPPPDLVVEMDVTHRSIDRIPVYASLGVPEIWRYDLSRLSFLHLQADRSYAESETSRAFPFLLRATVERFLRLRPDVDTVSLLREFRETVKQIIRPS